MKGQRNVNKSMFNWTLFQKQLLQQVFTLDRPQSKTLILSTTVDRKSVETEFSIVICLPIGGK